ncbi:MAG: FAD-dependent oxidoreductase, partial [Bacteroidetes bacterium]|nr:FAD-dependent oxidoreductase [Bacteroidota bacterium]
MIEKELIIIGGGPAGLSAAVEAAKKGVETLLLDENLRAGGQLFKQIHKFFGSHAHQA